MAAATARQVVPEAAPASMEMQQDLTLQLEELVSSLQLAEDQARCRCLGAERVVGH